LLSIPELKVTILAGFLEVLIPELQFPIYITDMVTKPQFGGEPFSIASLALSTQDCAVRVVVDTAASVRKIRHDNSVF
jgi:hypothetical protein